SANVHAGALDTAFEYDPATNTWRSLAPLSKPRGSVGVATLDGKLHAIGGRGLDKVAGTTHEGYHPPTRHRASRPHCRLRAIICPSSLRAASSMSSAAVRPTTRLTTRICMMSTIRRPTVGAQPPRCRPRAAPQELPSCEA